MAEIAKKHKYILITNGESYVGRTMAIHIADELEHREGKLKKSHWRVRVLCENKHKMDYLEKRGIDVKEVDYESEHMLREQMKDHIKIMIFNPFCTKDGRMAMYGKNLIDAAMHEKVKRAIMISSFGCEMAEDNESPMGQFKQAENHFRKCFEYGYWLIFRIPFIQQYMYFWKSMIENKSRLGMPMSKHSLLTMVNIKDVLECVSIACLSKKSAVWSAYANSGNESDNSSSDDLIKLNKPSSKQLQTGGSHSTGMKKLFMLHSMQPMSLKMIAESLMKALKHDDSGLDIDTIEMEYHELESYLKYIAENMDHCSTNPSSFDLASKHKSNHEDHLAWHPMPKEDLKHFQIKLIIDHFKMAHCSDVVAPLNNDVRDILGRDPIELRDFFMLNRRQFRPTAKKQ
ncbi:uncharacterized protein BX663DRAFT_490236 [Cokeromyces recurvatus]|uniref:uncharacterized protein n=1 Tax=Cokeromyces recurvatus TaxID=90255 RepID=UPI00221F8FA8|nr:uncharacterized protein BX663DRAFT_490236 [Cokeromyces recurvatus]KAI7898239.1 hypothetical protein BX663DRAFT_490236 [Cokeromyces recurvatus]